MLDALFRRRETKSASGDLYRHWHSLFGGWQSKSGIAITHQTALECITVLACARVIAEGLAQVPWKLMQEDAAGQKRVAKEEDLHELLSLAPNPWHTSFEFREILGLHLALARNAYVFVNRVRGGRIVELLPFKPGDIRPIAGDGLSEVVGYRVTWKNGRQDTLPAESIWHIRGLSWDGIEGLDGVRLAREAIGLDKVMEAHSSNLFAHGTKVSGVLQTEQSLTPDKAREFHEQWQELYAGPENAGSTPVLHSGLKWAQAAMTSLDAQLLEQRRFEVERICAAMRVLPIMIGMDGKTNSYNSVEQMFLAHNVHTLDPWFERVRQRADKDLLTREQRRNGYYTQFVTQGLLRAAHRDRAEYYSRALGAGGGPAWMTQDEIRGLEDMSPMGGTAAQLPVPSNVGTPPKAGNDNDNAS